MKYFDDKYSIEFQIEAASILCNLSDESSECSQMAIEYIPKFIKLLEISTNQELSIQLIGTIGNISFYFGEEVIDTGIIKLFGNLIDEFPKPPLLRKIFWCISILCKWTPLSDLILIIQKDLFNVDEEFLIHLTRTLSECCYSEEAIQDLLMHVQILERVSNLLYFNSNPEIQLNSIQIIRKICEGSDKNLDIILPHVAHQFESLLLNITKDIVLETILTISNVLCGSEDHIEVIIQSYLMPILLRFYKKSEMEYCIPIAKGFSIGSKRGNNQQTKLLIELGVLEIFILSLDGNISNEFLIIYSLETVRNLLNSNSTIISIEEKPKMIQTVSKFKNHKNFMIQDISNSIITIIERDDLIYSITNKFNSLNLMEDEKKIKVLGGIKNIIGIEKIEKELKLIVSFLSSENIQCLSYQNHKTEFKDYKRKILKFYDEYHEEGVIDLKIKKIEICNDGSFQVCSELNNLFELKKVTRNSLLAFLKYFK